MRQQISMGTGLQSKLSATVAQSLQGGSQIRIELKDASDKPKY